MGPSMDSLLHPAPSSPPSWHPPWPFLLRTISSHCCYLFCSWQGQHYLTWNWKRSKWKESEAHMTDAEESLLSLESCHSPVSIPRHFSPPPRHSSPPTSGEAEAGLLPRVPPPPKKCHLIFCPPLTGFFRLISVVNSFTPGRFEGSPPGSPAQKVHCTTTHCTSHAAHRALQQAGYFLHLAPAHCPQ